ncbi:MAG: lysophospholipid acyltransferase family protein [Bryobacterales bacterium]|nr:lysophospholipid acyltransferase family protein [Bryobacterales bacterium]
MLHTHLPGAAALGEIYSRIRISLPDTTIGSRLLNELRVRVHTAAADIAHVPRTGPVVLVLNHPTGLLEGAVLMQVLQGIRGDVRFLANSMLAAVPELEPWIIPVDVFGGAARDNLPGMKHAVSHLIEGGLLVVFPAGEVSHFQWRKLAVCDGEWHPSIARMVAMANRRTTGVKVVPAFLSGSNSVLFQCAGILHPRLRSLLLVRELLCKRGVTVDLRIGRPIAATRLNEFATPAERTGYLRWRCELLATRQRFQPRTRLPLFRRSAQPEAEAVAAAQDPATLAAEIACLPSECRLVSSGTLTAYIAPAPLIPNTIAEIGRLREIAFRAAGEGTGKRTDLDSFDPHYQHLFLWNAEKQEIAGAYRLAPTDTTPSLYTSTLFRYGPEFLQRMGPAVELGRSFVRLEYQKSFAPLLLLWKGIGAWIAAHPRYKVLFGPVSISNRYQALSRDLMIGFLERYALLPEWKPLVETRNPFRAAAGAPESFFRTCSGIEELAEVVSDIEASPEGVPVLLRQYLKLGGKLLGFNVDPEFSNVVDGLIVVDLTRAEPRLLERYLGREQAHRFLIYHER